MDSPSSSSAATMGVPSEGAVGNVNGNEVGTTASFAGYMETRGVREARVLASELCRHMYTLGWFSGTGGSITIKVHDDSIPKPRQLVVISPSGLSLSLSHSLHIIFLHIYIDK